MNKKYDVVIIGSGIGGLTIGSLLSKTKKILVLEKNNNFVVDGVYTHNSTTLAAKMSLYGSIIPAFKTLYVSPTSKQTMVFSSVRLKDLLDSKFIRKHLVDKTCDAAVFKKSLRFIFYTPFITIIL